MVDLIWVFRVNQLKSCPWQQKSRKCSLTSVGMLNLIFAINQHDCKDAIVTSVDRISPKIENFYTYLLVIKKEKMPFKILNLRR